jgi:hypothetical protein
VDLTGHLAPRRLGDRPEDALAGVDLGAIVGIGEEELLLDPDRERRP